MLNGLPLQSIMVAKRRAGVVYFYLRVPLQIKAVYQSLLGFPYTVLTLKLTGFYPLNLRRFLYKRPPHHLGKFEMFSNDFSFTKSYELV